MKGVAYVLLVILVVVLAFMIASRVFGAGAFRAAGGGGGARGEAPAELCDGSPRAPYRAGAFRGARAVLTHLGQRKLLLGEVEFITRHGRPGMTLVYVGAAPGHHTRFLLSLFPRGRAGIAAVHLYDPVKFSRRLAGVPGVTLYCRPFTDADAAGWAGKKNVLFVSDIRRFGRQGAGPTVVEAQVSGDLAAQRGWVETIRPVAALLKFRFPFDARAPLEYLDGRVSFQAWPPPSSTETRLEIVRPPGDGRYPTRTYDPVAYEEQLSHHNTVDRTLSRYDMGGAAGHGLDGCYDCAREVGIWRAYFRGWGGAAGRALVGAGPGGAAPVGDIVGAAGKALGQTLTRPPHSTPFSERAAAFAGGVGSRGRAKK